LLDGDNIGLGEEGLKVYVMLETSLTEPVAICVYGSTFVGSISRYGLLYVPEPCAFSISAPHENFHSN
jgi:hypothetical protein